MNFYRNLSVPLLFILLTVSALGHATHQQFGERNINGASELAQYDFLIGEWEVAVILKQPEKPDLHYQAKWINKWIADGFVVLQQWFGPYAKGIELRSYDVKNDTWLGQNSYQPNPGGWYSNKAKFIDGEMLVTTHKKSPDGTPLISKEIYHNISRDSFAIRSEESKDNGATWQPGHFTLVATRIK